MNNTEALEISVSLEEAKKTLDIKNSIDRLYSNPDFKKVVLEGYFKEEAARLVHLRSDPEMRAKENQQIELMLDIDAIGRFSNYLRTQIFKGNHALKAIEDYEEEIKTMDEE